RARFFRCQDNRNRCTAGRSNPLDDRPRAAPILDQGDAGAYRLLQQSREFSVCMHFRAGLDHSAAQMLSDVRMCRNDMDGCLAHAAPPVTYEALLKGLLQSEFNDLTGWLRRQLA